MSRARSPRNDNASVAMFHQCEMSGVLPFSDLFRKTSKCAEDCYVSVPFFAMALPSEVRINRLRLVRATTGSKAKSVSTASEASHSSWSRSEGSFTGHIHSCTTEQCYTLAIRPIWLFPFFIDTYLHRQVIVTRSREHGKAGID